MLALDMTAVIRRKRENLNKCMNLSEIYLKSTYEREVQSLQFLWYCKLSLNPLSGISIEITV